ncbi:hypothetical protein SDC9_184402 [bioreactor metagenome]|uniref:Uncharacterized protein n=1 Tax=bioreactor metagenome TaxID=1076179 RepID=A0A645HDU1_9ZZZZ
MPGLAWPLVCFMIWPTRKPLARSFPALKSSTDCWLLSKTALMIGNNWAGSLIWIRPSASTTDLASPPFVANRRKTFLAIFVLMVPSSINVIMPARFAGVSFVSASSTFSLFRYAETSPINQLEANLASAPAAMVPSKKSDISFESVNTIASYSGKSYSEMYLSRRFAGISGMLAFTRSIHSWEMVKPGRSGSGK